MSIIEQSKKRGRFFLAVNVCMSIIEQSKKKKKIFFSLPKF